MGSYTKPVIDITIIAKRGILPDIPTEMIQNLSKLGYIYCGPSPHRKDVNYQLFIRKCSDTEIKKQNGNKAFQIHLITAKEAEKNLKGFLTFRATCNGNQKYKEENCQ